jgi:hypothetical protein
LSLRIEKGAFGPEGAKATVPAFFSPRQGPPRLVSQNAAHALGHLRNCYFLTMPVGIPEILDRAFGGGRVDGIAVRRSRWNVVCSGRAQVRSGSTFIQGVRSIGTRGSSRAAYRAAVRERRSRACGAGRSG